MLAVHPVDYGKYFTAENSRFFAVDFSKGATVMWKSKCKKAVSICTFFAVLFSSLAGLSGLIAQSAQNS